MIAPALTSSYPKWCRVLAAIAATLILVVPVGLLLLAMFGWDPTAAGSPGSDEYYGGYPDYSEPTDHWIAYVGIGFFFSELHPLLWLARGGRRGRTGRPALFGMLTHVIVTATLLLIAASCEGEEGFIPWMIAFASQFVWALYYAAILSGEDRTPDARLEMTP